MGEPRKPQLRWKRHEPARGLARIGAPPRGWDLRYGSEKVGSVSYAYRSLSRRDGGGWFWTARSDDGRIPYKNSCSRLLKSPDDAKSACEKYVRKHLGLPPKGSRGR